MAYVKQGPFAQGGICTSANLTAMDDGIAAAQSVGGVDLGSVSGAIALDALVAGFYTASLSGAATISLANIHQAGISVMVTLFLTANGNAATFDSSIIFPSLQPGTLAGAPDLLRFIGMPGETQVYGELVESY